MKFKKIKKAFTLLEVLISLILFSIILVISIKAYGFFSQNSQSGIIDYMALAKIDSEMNRLVYAYENHTITDFTEKIDDTLPYPYDESWKEAFEVPLTRDWVENVKIYKVNPLNESYGLSINGRWHAERNTIEIIDNSDNPNEVDNGDIVGVLGWKVYNFPDVNSTTHAYLSLSITYPYRAVFVDNEDNGEDEFSHEEINGLALKTINLKTVTQVK